ncbi:MAG: DUF4440 domain-containing protein [Parasphingorhabdus sp.]|uniref:YybH family protein n=1 Tax=Parasphingorhabdus sp. TaxID=2709688 RepID=UPI0032975C57
MTGRILFIAALGVSLVANPTAAEPAISAPAHSDAKAIVAHGALWKKLFEAGDIAAMRDLYEEDAWLMTHGAPAAKGVNAILTYLQRNKDRGNRVSFSFTPEDITINGNTGYLISKYWMNVVTPGNEKFTAAGRSFLVFKKGTDGKWRLWRDMDNQAPDVTASDQPEQSSN